MRTPSLDSAQPLSYSDERRLQHSRQQHQDLTDSEQGRFARHLLKAVAANAVDGSAVGDSAVGDSASDSHDHRAEAQSAPSTLDPMHVQKTNSAWLDRLAYRHQPLSSARPDSAAVARLYAQIQRLG